MVSMAPFPQAGVLSLAAPEGVWVLASERVPAAVSFNPDLVTKLEIANVTRGAYKGTYVLWCTHCSIFVYNAQLADREPLRRIELRHPAGGNMTQAYVTCLAHASDGADDFDLLIGMSNGDVRVLSLSAQMAASPINMKPISPIAYPPDSTLTSPRCVAVEWMHGSKAGSFVAVHADGNVLIHQKIVGSSSDTKLLERTASESSIRPPVAQLYYASSFSNHDNLGLSTAVTAASISPCGTMLALACRDGVLRILSTSSGALFGGFKSFYGALLCVGWSADGKYLAAGGEDDLIAVWGFDERGIVGHLEGHSSWVSAVAFDPVEPSDGSYRIASVGQDCQLGLWEIAVGDRAEVTTPRAATGLNDLYVDTPMTLDSTCNRSRQVGEVAEAPTRAEMTILAPLLLHKVHVEPLTDVRFLPDALLVAAHDGSVKRWQRPLRQHLGRSLLEPMG